MMHFTLPLQGGRELRLIPDGERYSLECWSRYQDGRALMAGGFRLGPHELRLFAVAVKDALWHVERATAVVVPQSMPQADGGE